MKWLVISCLSWLFAGKLFIRARRDKNSQGFCFFSCSCCSSLAPAPSPSPAAVDKLLLLLLHLTGVSDLPLSQLILLLASHPAEPPQLLLLQGRNNLTVASVDIHWGYDTQLSEH